MTRILVIKLAALGDFVQALGPMRRIRGAHPRAHITLLTTPPFVSLAEASGLFDKVEADGRPKRATPTLAMLRRLRGAGYARVYDLQTSQRSSSYRLAFWPRFPEWSGVAFGASHPHAEPRRDQMHTLERQADQLRHAGIWPDAPTGPGTAPAPDLDFLTGRLGPDRQPAHFGLSKDYALLVPGASPQRPGKRWPPARFAELARALTLEGLEPVVVGGPAEIELGRWIAEESGARNLAGRTDFAQLAGLAMDARLAVGNDTGPMHLIAAAGAPTLVMYGPDSDPSLCAPRGLRVQVVSAPNLQALETSQVLQAALALTPRTAVGA